MTKKRVVTAKASEVRAGELILADSKAWSRVIRSEQAGGMVWLHTYAGVVIREAGALIRVKVEMTV